MSLYPTSSSPCGLVKNLTHTIMEPLTKYTLPLYHTRHSVLFVTATYAYVNLPTAIQWLTMYCRCWKNVMNGIDKQILKSYCHLSRIRGYFCFGAAFLSSFSWPVYATRLNWQIGLLDNVMYMKYFCNSVWLEGSVSHLMYYATWRWIIE